MRRIAATVLGTVLLLAGCSPGASASGNAAGDTTPGTSASPATSHPSLAAAGLPRPAHVVVAVFENEAAGAVIGSSAAPYLTGLARSGANFTDAHGVTHPSEPNYLAMFSGSTHGVTDDRCPLSFSGGNLAGQLRAAGLSFVGYSEGLPATGYTGCTSGNYARKHNPWVDFPALPASVNQPLSAMPGTFADLPTVSFVVPDLCNDMHDCSVATGDAWARAHLAPYASWARTHDSLLIVTFDEDNGTAANHIATFVVGAGVRQTASSQRIDHYSLLRTLEEMYRLPPLGAAASAAPFTGIWG
jgi:phosphatidylinositol-3-phosphatase